MTCVEEMAKLCNTSLTATAFRYAELTDDKKRFDKYRKV